MRLLRTAASLLCEYTSDVGLLERIAAGGSSSAPPRQPIRKQLSLRQSWHKRRHPIGRHSSAWLPHLVAHSWLRWTRASFAVEDPPRPARSALARLSFLVQYSPRSMLCIKIPMHELFSQFSLASMKLSDRVAFKRLGCQFLKTVAQVVFFRAKGPIDQVSA